MHTHTASQYWQACPLSYPRLVLFPGYGHTRSLAHAAGTRGRLPPYLRCPGQSTLFASMYGVSAAVYGGGAA
eukprot:1515224-Rhodomonas_salina.1